MCGKSLFFEEMEVLQAIYEDELIMLQSNDSLAETKITIHPSTADDKDGKYVCLTLHFLFTFSLTPMKNYPHKGPEISISNPRGLSESHLASIEENLRSLVTNMVGEQMLFSLIEYARESLTDNNHPSCVCPICLEKFEEGGVFFRTDCYHYFHKRCIKCYIDISENMVCPVCRLEFHVDESTLKSEEDEDKGISEEEIVIDKTFFEWRRKFDSLYEKQRRNGGIIDPEYEKNKYLITLNDAPTVQNESSLIDQEVEMITAIDNSLPDNRQNSPNLRFTKPRSEAASAKRYSPGPRVNSPNPKYVRPFPPKHFDEVNMSKPKYDKSDDLPSSSSEKVHSSDSDPTNISLLTLANLEINGDTSKCEGTDKVGSHSSNPHMNKYNEKETHAMDMSPRKTNDYSKNRTASRNDTSAASGNAGKSKYKRTDERRDYRTGYEKRRDNYEHRNDYRQRGNRDNKNNDRGNDHRDKNKSTDFIRHDRVREKDYDYKRRDDRYEQRNYSRPGNRRQPKEKFDQKERSMNSKDATYPLSKDIGPGNDRENQIESIKSDNHSKSAVDNGSCLVDCSGELGDKQINQDDVLKVGNDKVYDKDPLDSDLHVSKHNFNDQADGEKLSGVSRETNLSNLKSAPGKNYSKRHRDTSLRKNKNKEKGMNCSTDYNCEDLSETSKHVEKRPPPGLEKVISKESITAETFAMDGDLKQRKQPNARKPPPGFQKIGASDVDELVLNENCSRTSSAVSSQRNVKKAPPGFQKIGASDVDELVLNEKCSRTSSAVSNQRNAKKAPPGFQKIGASDVDELVLNENCSRTSSTVSNQRNAKKAPPGFQ